MSAQQLGCSVEACGRLQHSRGVCNGHYKRLKMWGELRPEVPLQERVHSAGQVCITDGCTRLARVKMRCGAHYDRHRRTGSDRPWQPLKPIRYDWDDLCSVAGCQKAARKLGRCETHYQRFRATGCDERPDCCGICGAACVPAWDHSHWTGQHRGWICTRCNLVLGSAGDDPDLLRQMADYLERA
jgi:hypothetical protein